MPVAAGPTPTKAQLLTLLRGFFLQIMPAGFEAVEGQANRVPEVTSDNYVVMTPMGFSRISTNVVTWSAAPLTAQIDREQDVVVRCQLDFHGAGAFDNVTLAMSLLRSSYCVDFFNGSGIAPLYMNEGKQIPFISGEDQYEDRWVLDAFFQMNISVATTQQFADTLTVGIKEIDTYYPPGG